MFVFKSLKKLILANKRQVYELLVAEMVKTLNESNNERVMRGAKTVLKLIFTSINQKLEQLHTIVTSRWRTLWRRNRKMKTILEKTLEKPTANESFKDTRWPPPPSAGIAPL